LYETSGIGFIGNIFVTLANNGSVSINLTEGSILVYPHQGTWEVAWNYRNLSAKAGAAIAHETILYEALVEFNQSSYDSVLERLGYDGIDFNFRIDKDGEVLLNYGKEVPTGRAIVVAEREGKLYRNGKIENVKIRVSVWS
jgi:hypothetical protein